ncbi:MAG: SMC family ATPase [Pyrinomonadaceae bacterium]
MHVTRVELENIKSYTSAEFSFERGTTAIVGPNGAGKTTILEAIAWSLFDQLEYSKDDFLRRGAKKGSVRVTFESDVDQRQYTIYRDTGQGYYVFDPVLGVRIAEKKQDTASFLRQHLGVEPGTDLRSLFRSAIGVPQGSFTAEFLLTSNARRAAFDRLLKVEEYREGAERLRDTNGLIRERTARIRERIASAEGQLARYDELIVEHKAAVLRAGELESALGDLQREAAERAASVSLLDEAERRVAEARAQADRLAARHEAIENQLIGARRELEAAERASLRQRATVEGHNQHLAALEALRRLDVERSEREPLRLEEGRVAALAGSAELDVRRLEEALARARQAAVAAHELHSAIDEQESLERERERLRDLRARAQAARQACARLDRDLEMLRAQHMQTRERVRGAEAAAGAQKLVEELESERIYIENELARERDLALNRKHFAKENRELEQEVNRLRDIVAALDREARAYEQLSSGAVRASVLEQREQELGELMARLRAEITRDEKMRAEVKGGLCPILSQKCLNIGEDQTLEGYFTDHLAANHASLAEVEGERSLVSRAVREARAATIAASKMETAQARLAQERMLLVSREKSLNDVQLELQKIPSNGDHRLRDAQTRMLGIDGELKSAREAALRFSELETQRGRLKEIEEEGKRKKEERAELIAAADATGQMETEIGEVEQRLQSRADPRGRALSLRVEGERADSLAAELGGARSAWESLHGQKQTLQQQLARFAALDATWTAESAKRDRTEAAYREFLACELPAKALDARQSDFTRVSAESARIAHEADGARLTHENAAAAYDRARHGEERGALALARERIAVTAAQLQATQESARVRAAEITRLDGVRAGLREEFAEKDRLEELNETTDFIRDVLKLAGPLVTESYLYNISVEANQLFRDITGEASRTLRWSRDYEIILEEDGYDRPFPNLSGGEQMAAALSVRLAMLKQLSDIRIAFFDEPTINMDAERRERLALSIGQIRDFHQLFVISHDDTFEESVDHIVHIRKDEGGRMKDEG